MAELAAYHNTLRQFQLTTVITQIPPPIWFEWNLTVCAFKLLWSRKPGGTMLSITDCFGLDAIEVVHVGCCGDQAKDRQHRTADDN